MHTLYIIKKLRGKLKEKKDKENIIGKREL